MAISFHSTSQTSSTECLLSREPHLSPPRSQHSLKDIPFKAKESDRISLNMKRGKRRSYDSPRPLWQQAFNQSEQDILDKSPRKRKKQKRNHRRPIMSRSVSLPVLQPRLTHSTIELRSDASFQRRARRWTIPSKAPSTRGLASITPVDPGEGLRHGPKENLLQSPAMITLRRATMGKSSRRMSLTSFPTPQFGRYSNGFLSSFLSSIIPKEAGKSNQKPTFLKLPTESHRVLSASISSAEAQPCISTTAPVVRTELIVMEPQGSNSSEILKLNPTRRCSTRFVSDESVYEILWDEDSSSTSSEGSTIPKVDQGPVAGRRHSSAIDGLQFQLSRASTRRGSIQVTLAGIGVELHGDENQTQSRFQGLVNSQVTKFTGVKFLQNLPGIRTTRAEHWKSCVNREQDDVVREIPWSQSRNGHGKPVDFFPPLGGPAEDTGQNRRSRDSPLCPAKSYREDANGRADSNQPVIRNHCSAASIDARTHARLDRQRKSRSRPRDKFKVQDNERRGQAGRPCTAAGSSTQV